MRLANATPKGHSRCLPPQSFRTHSKGVRKACHRHDDRLPTASSVPGLPKLAALLVRQRVPSIDLLPSRPLLPKIWTLRLKAVLNPKGGIPQHILPYPLPTLIPKHAEITCMKANMS